MKVAYITARRPSDVAQEVDAMRKEGYRKFILRALAHGEMLDLERLGAARYIAGLQVEVELEDQASSEVSTVPVGGGGAR